MKRVGKSVWVRITPQQEEFLNALSERKNKSISEVIRDVIQENIEKEKEDSKLKINTSYTVKTYALLKQFVKDYHEDEEDTFNKANTSADAILEALHTNS